MSELLTRLLTLIEHLVLTPLCWLFPIKWEVIEDGSSGVRFTFGRPGPTLGPGWRLATTGQSIKKQHTARCTVPLQTMQVLTADGVPFKIHTVVVVRIADLSKYLTGSEDSLTLINETAEAVVRQEIQLRPLRDFLHSSAEMEEHAQTRLNDELRDLGVHILRVGIKSIEHVDPITRTMLSSPVAVTGLSKAIAHLRDCLPDVSSETLLATVSPAVQYTMPVHKTEPPHPQDGYETLETTTTDGKPEPAVVYSDN